jgi:zinc/manganese transport system substrate-binding protein
MMRILVVSLIALFVCVPAQAAQKLKVLATFSIVGDIVGRVAGDKVELTTLVGPDGDAHAFEPATADARALGKAQLIFANGLAFEPWLARLVQSSGSKAKIVSLSDGVKPLLADGAPDPHAWQDVRNAVNYAENTARALAAADTANAATYAAKARAYVEELRRLDAEIRSWVAAVPKDRRRVITSHDAFAYFGAAYGIAFVAPLGASTEQQASAKGVAALIDQIKREKITAVFVENISDPRLMQQIARETGVKLGGELYSDALSEASGPAPTYIAMMRHNATLLTKAMAGAL